MSSSGLEQQGRGFHYPRTRHANAAGRCQCDCAMPHHRLQAHARDWLAAFDSIVGSVPDSSAFETPNSQHSSRSRSRTLSSHARLCCASHGHAGTSVRSGIKPTRQPATPSDPIQLRSNSQQQQPAVNMLLSKLQHNCIRPASCRGPRPAVAPVAVPAPRQGRARAVQVMAYRCVPAAWSARLEQSKKVQRPTCMKPSIGSPPGLKLCWHQGAACHTKLSGVISYSWRT